jgi:membrane protein YdbS with pleckstrin-like domain
MDTPGNDGSDLWYGRPAWSGYSLLWLFVAILAIRGILFTRIVPWPTALLHAVPIILLTAIAVGLRQTSHFRLTRTAVYRSKGILGKQEQAFPLPLIQTADERQGPLDRLFGTGDVILHFKDGTHERLAGVKDPEIISRKIRALI